MDLNFHSADRDQDMSRRKYIIVSGMHRSGARACVDAYARPAQRFLPSTSGPNIFNPKDYFGSEALLSINEAILRELRSSWFDFAHLDLATLDPAKRNDLTTRISQAVAAEFTDASLFVVKDPRICRLMPLWREALDTIGLDLSVMRCRFVTP